MTGTLQTQLVVFICAYLYSITGTRNFLFFYFPHVQLSTGASEFTAGFKWHSVTRSLVLCVCIVL
jgi:hypothetical protein